MKFRLFNPETFDTLITDENDFESYEQWKTIVDDYISRGYRHAVDWDSKDLIWAMLHQGNEYKKAIKPKQRVELTADEHLAFILRETFISWRHFDMTSTALYSKLCKEFENCGDMPEGWPESPLKMVEVFRRLEPVFTEQGFLLNFHIKEGQKKIRLVFLKDVF